jgi:hypothetical protein
LGDRGVRGAGVEQPGVGAASSLSASVAPAHPDAASPPRRLVDKNGRFQNDYFIVALPPPWKLERGSRTTAVFIQGNGGARIRATAITSVDAAVHAR